MKRRCVVVLLPLTVFAIWAFALAEQSFAATGSLSGTVTDAVSHAGIAEIQVYASLLDVPGPPAAEAVTGTDGSYTITGMTPGTYIVQFDDQDGSANGGQFAREYYNDAVCQDFADPVVVGDGATVSGIDAALSGCGTIYGWVTGGNERLLTAAVQAYTWVGAHQAWEWYPLEWQNVDSGGNYVLERVRVGQWALRFMDTAGVYASEYHANAHSPEAAQMVLVTPGATINIQGVLELGGTISGHVWNNIGAPVPDTLVALQEQDPVTAQWGWAGVFTWTGPDGSYSIGQVDTWNYRLMFQPPDGSGLVREYWNNRAAVEDAQDLALGIGQVLSGVDARLGSPDTVAPVTGITGLPASGSSRLPLTLALIASDSGSGVELTRYRLDGGAWTAGTALDIAAPSTHANDGLHVIEYRSADYAGNWEQIRTSQVQIDTTAPTGAMTLAGVPAGWSRRNVTFTLTATDAASDVASIEYSLGAGSWTPFASAVAVSTVGETPLSYRALDAAGNVGEAHTATVRIDKTGPTTRALAKVAVAKGRKASFRLRVNDRTPTAAVTVKIFKGKKLVKRLSLGQRTTNTALTYRWRCALAKGSYTWKIYATDLAGNRQLRVGSSTLRVH